MINHINLLLTRRCNSKCRYCYMDAEDMYSGNDADYQSLVSFLELFKESGGVSVQFTGGEPFLYKKIDKLIEVCNLLDLRISIFTNGLLVNEDVVMRNKSLVDKYILSFDGLTHNMNRGVKDAHKRIIDVFKILKKHQIDFSTQMVVGKENITEIQDVANIVKEYGAKSIRMASLMSIGRGSNCADVLSEEELLFLKNHATEIAFNHDYSIHVNTNLLTSKEILMYVKNNCNMLTSYWVTPNGDIFIFSPFIEDFKIGHISDFLSIDFSLLQNRLKYFFNVLFDNIKEKLICDICEEINKYSYEFADNLINKDGIKL